MILLQSLFVKPLNYGRISGSFLGYKYVENPIPYKEKNIVHVTCQMENEAIAKIRF